VPATHGKQLTYTTADGLKLAFRTFGQGPPLLLLAGGPGQISDYMLPVAERLAQTRKVILPDQRGTGESDKPPVTRENYQLAKYVADLEALRQHLGIHQWDVLGHSWGGTLGMAHACEHPSTIKSLILVSTCGANTDFLTPALEELRSRLNKEDLALLSKSLDPEFAKSHPAEAARAGNQAFLPAFFYNRSRGEKLRNELNLEGMPGVFGTVFGAMRDEKINLLPCLRDVDAPSLVIHGDHDHIPVRFVQEVANALPKSKFVLLEHCGHFPWIEAEESFYESVLTITA